MSEYSPPQGRPPSVFLTPFSSESLGLKFQGATGAGVPASAVYPVTNAVFFYPFTLSTTAVVNRFFWCNGTTAVTNSLQVGVYDRNGNAIVLGTSTVASGTSAPQFDNVTDFSLSAGRYYMAIRGSGTTTHLLRVAPVLGRLRTCGVYNQTGQSTLPTPTATFAQLATAYVPVFGLAFRSTP